MHRSHYVVALFVVGVLLASTSMAQTTGVNWSGTTGLMFMDTAETLDPGYLSINVYGHYLHNEIYEWIDDEYEVDPGLTLGITRRLELAVVQPWIAYDGHRRGGPDSFRDHDGATDLTLSAKYGFLQESEGDPFGLALKAHGVFPTGETTDGLSRDDFDFGFLGIVSKQLGQFDIHGNLGGVWTGNQDIEIRSTGDQEDYLTGAVGWDYRFNENWMFFNEFHADSRTINDSHPWDVTGGVRWLSNDSRLAVTTGLTGGFNDAVVDWRVGVGVTYAFGPLWGAAPAPTQPPPPVATATPAPPAPTKTPKPEPTKVEAPVEPLPVFKILYFDFDKSDLRPASVTELNKVVDILNKNPNYRLRVEGHACKMGTHEYNQKLSERRANAAKAYLLKQGIAADRVEAIGYGETRPAVPQKDTEREPLNRRVEMIVLSLQEM